MTDAPLIELAELNAIRKAADRLDKKNYRVSDLANKLLDAIDNQGMAISHLSQKLDDLYADAKDIDKDNRHSK